MIHFKTKINFPFLSVIIIASTFSSHKKNVLSHRHPLPTFDSKSFYLLNFLTSEKRDTNMLDHKIPLHYHSYHIHNNLTTCSSSLCLAYLLLINAEERGNVNTLLVVSCCRHHISSVVIKHIIIISYENG